MRVGEQLRLAGGSGGGRSQVKSYPNRLIPKQTNNPVAVNNDTWVLNVEDNMLS